MLELTQRLLRAAAGGEPVVLAAVFEPGATALVAGTRMLVETSGERMGSLGDAAIDDLVAGYALEALPRHAAETVYLAEGGLTERTVPGATSIYIEVVESKPVFFIVGAGHIGRSLSKIAAFLDFHVVVVDDREEFANSDNLPEADEILCADYEESIDNYPINVNTSIVMVSRGHKQDELALRRCLGRGAGYIGMIGSKRRTTTVLAHLADEGFDPAELAAIRTPIGIDIGAETPEEIAISIMAEVVMLRRGASAKPMYHRSGSVVGSP
ncbi:MAG: XdhC/CoxI family protein [Tepidiformaceae bacterium]